MKDLEQDDPSDETSLDREIAQALTVEPSPAFLPRVRSAVADDPPRGWWHRPWAWVASVSAAAATVAAFALLRMPVQLPPPPTPPAALVTSSRPSPAELPAQRPANAAVARPTSRLARAPTLSGQPEVLIDRDEAAALRRLMRGGRPGAIELSAVDAAVDGAEPGGPPARLVVVPLAAILPISIEPLGLEEGKEQ